MNSARLMYLAEKILPAVPRGQLKMETWTCGTAACAVGWAAQDPHFNELGLKLVLNSHSRVIQVPMYKIYHSWVAVAEFFDISEPQAMFLFSRFSYEETLKDLTPYTVSTRLLRFANDTLTPEEKALLHNMEIE